MAPNPRDTSSLIEGNRGLIYNTSGTQFPELYPLDTSLVAFFSRRMMIGCKAGITKLTLLSV